jgi:hypothetical protein
MFKKHRHSALDILCESPSMDVLRSYLPNANFVDVNNNGIKCDCIINANAHHVFDDQVKVVRNAVDRLKPGGVLIIEGVLKHVPEAKYASALASVLEHFQSLYFITMNHDQQKSRDDNKMFVLVRGGAAPIFNLKKKLVIITPCSRPINLSFVKTSVPFGDLCKWVIVYDGNHVPSGFSQFLGDPKIEEHVFASEGISGNPQRNYGLDLVEKEFGDDSDNTYLYFLDDDNVVHPNFHKLLDVVDSGKIYTFNQTGRLKGDRVALNAIDTAMFMVSLDACKGLRWVPDKYNADGLFIIDCAKKNNDRWVYVDNDLSFYNKLQTI